MTMTGREMDRNGRDREGARGAREGGRRRHPRDREAVRPRLDHEARLDRAAGGRFIPTGSIALDLALGVGGIPRGRITEIFGPESSGKTTLCQHVIAEAQRAGGIAAFIDVEHALDPGYARACGVNVDELLVSQPDTGEQALEITETLIRSGGVDIVVAGLRRGPRAAGGDRGRDGRQLRRHPGPAHEPGAAQAHRRGQPLQHRRSSSPTSCARRSASCSATPRPRRAAARSSSTPRSASTSAASRPSRPARSRSATASASRSSRTRWRRRSASPSSTSCTARASAREGGLLDVGVAMDVVTKTGAWFTFGDTRLGQGREASKEFLKANADVAAEIDRRIRAKMSDVDAAGRGHRGGRVAGVRPTADAGPPARARTAGRPRFAERRERRAAVEDVGEVLDAAARFLEARPRSVAEVRRRLTRPGYRAPLVDGAIERLAELGYLDDEAFARAWVESRDRARPRGEHALAPGAAPQGRRPRVVVDAVLERRGRAAAAGRSRRADDGRATPVRRADRGGRRRNGCCRAPCPRARTRGHRIRSGPAPAARTRSWRATAFDPDRPASRGRRRSVGRRETARRRDPRRPAARSPEPSGPV